MLNYVTKPGSFLMKGVGADCDNFNVPQNQCNIYPIFIIVIFKSSMFESCRPTLVVAINFIFASITSYILGYTTN